MTLARILFGIGALFASAPTAQAQAWKPERPVEIIVGTSPGGSIDRIARTAHKIFQDAGWLTGATVVNKAGGGGTIGYIYLNQNPGGHHIAINSLTMITNNITGRSQIRHDDITPIAMLVSEYVTFSVRSDSPIKDARDFLERVRKDPAAVSIAGASALGSSNHIATGLAMKAAGVDVRKARFVVFNSSGDSMTAVLGGHVDVLTTSASTAIPQVQAGKLRMIAIAAPKRTGGALAEVPTWRENGVNAVFSNWFGAIGPKAMPENQVAYWEELFDRTVKAPEWQATLDKWLWVNEYMGAKAARKYIEDQHNQVKVILTELGVAK